MNNIFKKFHVLTLLSIMASMTIYAQSFVVENSVFLDTVSDLLNQGYDISFSTKGRSMRPIIQDGDIILLQKVENVDLYDIVLAKISSDKYVLHRVICIDGERVTLMGDANQYPEICTKSEIAGVAKSLSNGDGYIYYLEGS